MISTPHVAKWIYKRQLERERGRRRERVKLLLIKTGRHGTRGGSSDIIRNFRRNIRRNHPDLQAALREIVAGIVYKGKSGGEDVSIANSHLNFQKDLALALLGEEPSGLFPLRVGMHSVSYHKRIASADRSHYLTQPPELNKKKRRKK